MDHVPLLLQFHEGLGIDVLDVKGGDVTRLHQFAQLRRVVVITHDLVSRHLTRRGIRRGVQYDAQATQLLGPGHHHASQLAPADDAQLGERIAKLGPARLVRTGGDGPAHWATTFAQGDMMKAPPWLSFAASSRATTLGQA